MEPPELTSFPLTLSGKDNISTSQKLGIKEEQVEVKTENCKSDNDDETSEKEDGSKSECLEKPAKSKVNFSCQDCLRKFRFSGSYLKHKKLYPFKHKYYKCCKSFEKDEVKHECSKIRKRKRGTDGKFTNRKRSRNVEHESDCNIQSKTEHVDDEDAKTDNHVKKEKDEINSENTLDDMDVKNEVESEPEEADAFDELFTKQKRTYKRKTASEKLEEQKTKIYKCQDCAKSFNRYSSLGFHIKVVHEKRGKFKCQTCDEEFSTKEAYRIHVSMHGPEDKVLCKGCRKVFDSLKLYYVHAKQNPGVHCFLCKLCLRKFPSELLLEQHVCICQNGKPLYCACGMEFTKYQDVIAHSKGTKPFHCCSCPHLATSLTAYIRHLRKHSKQKPFQCTKCDMKFAVIDFLNIHNKREHKEEEKEEAENVFPANFKCSACDEKFSSAEDLKKHSSVHERVQCPDCGKLFKRNRLENHRNTHKRSASLCPECGRLFDTRFKLTQHIITIHNTEPVKCEVCGKVLKTKKILNEHMKTHLKSEVGSRIPQAICPMCGLGLAQKGSLARHILLMHEKHKIVPCDKTYTCQECSEVLPNKGKYYSHRRMHRAMVDRFPCEICGREFNKKQNLRRHIYLLHDERRVIEDPIYGCQICTRSFREKKNLRRHYKMVHKLDDVA